MNRLSQLGLVFLFLAACAGSPRRIPADDSVVFPSGTVVLPCEIARNLCYLRSDLNAHPVWMALDTGSSLTVLDSDKSKEFEFRGSGSGNAAGGASGGSNKFDIINGITIQNGSSVLHNQTIIAMPFKYVAQRVGHPTDGTLGSNVFSNYVVEVNYVENRVILTDPSAWNPATHGEALPISLEGNVPFIQASITLPDGQQIEGKFVVDSGQIISGLLITEGFQKAHPEILHYKKVLRPPSISAVGGEMEYSVSRIPQLRLGSVTIDNPVTSFPQHAVGIYARPDVAGAIGADLLSRFDVSFDYRHKLIYFKPNSAFRARSDFDMSGLQLGVNPPNYSEIQVTGIMDSTPASHAGLKKGDIVLAVNRSKPGELTLSEVLAILRRPNTHCKLWVKRANHKFFFTLHLQPLL